MKEEYIRMSVRTFNSKTARKFLTKCVCCVHKYLTGEFNLNPYTRTMNVNLEEFHYISRKRRDIAFLLLPS